MATFIVFTLIALIAGTAVYLAVTSLTQTTAFRVVHLIAAIILFFIAIIPTGYFHK